MLIKNENATYKIQSPQVKIKFKIVAWCDSEATVINTMITIAENVTCCASSSVADEPSMKLEYVLLKIDHDMK